MNNPPTDEMMNKKEPLYSSELRTSYRHYHEIIFEDDIAVAAVMGFKNQTYGFILFSDNHLTSKGYLSVCQCKEALFKALENPLQSLSCPLPLDSSSLICYH